MRFTCNNIRQDPSKPTKGCFDDVEWSKSNGRFYSFAACTDRKAILNGDRPPPLAPPGFGSKGTPAPPRAPPPPSIDDVGVSPPGPPSVATATTASPPQDTDDTIIFGDRGQ